MLHSIIYTLSCLTVNVHTYLSTPFVLDLSERVLACVALIVELSYAGSVSKHSTCCRRFLFLFFFWGGGDAGREKEREEEREEGRERRGERRGVRSMSYHLSIISMLV